MIELNFREAFPKNLARYMRMKDISVTQLAESVGVDKSTVSKWIHGKRLPMIETLMKTADILNATPDELLTWKEGDQT